MDVKCLVNEKCHVVMYQLFRIIIKTEVPGNQAEMVKRLSFKFEIPKTKPLQPTHFCPKELFT